VAISGGVGKFKEERANQRKAGSRGLIRERVKIRKQLIPRLDIVATDRFLLRAADPWLLIGRAFLGVIAIDGLKRA
jgi:hypothetical protein